MQTRRERIWSNYHSISSLLFWVCPSSEDFICQCIGNVLLKSIIKNTLFFLLSTSSEAAAADKEALTISHQGANALWYAAGYIPWAFVKKLKLSGAHTPCASAASGLYPDLNLELENVDDLYLHITLHCTWAESTWPAVDRRDKQKHSICDTHGPCQSIRNIVKPVFRRFRQSRYTYESLRCLDLVNWQFSWGQQTDNRQTNCFTPCACVRDN